MFKLSKFAAESSTIPTRSRFYPIFDRNIMETSCKEGIIRLNVAELKSKPRVTRQHVLRIIPPIPTPMGNEISRERIFET